MKFRLKVGLDFSHAELPNVSGPSYLMLTVASSLARIFVTPHSTTGFSNSPI